ncbi:hypothetical protein OPT61_g10218 [Boeremia exigua]|uniref:Uncharacterized protein n=1 Tax=Boeremia exigua TaxID=749465 RepID=A0ACC2HR74_9PLEO|nr:hypothetical protein OPT61_g10218 [Boeremia exigua]
MPGRTTTRSTRTTRAAAGTRSARSAAVEIPDEGPVTSLRTRIVHVFGDAQKTTATQRKLVVTLRKIQEECCYEPPVPVKKGKKAQEEEVEDFDEDDFNSEMMRIVLRIVNVKKSEPAGDRVVRFLATFLKHATEKDQINAAALDGEYETTDTPATRLNTLIFKIALRLLQSKDKTLRFRAVQIITHMVNNLEQIDDNIFALVKAGLTKRLRDKEPSVRVQAVLGLGRLISNDEDELDDEDDEDEANSILERLVGIMINDPDAQVRRTILSNIPFWPTTLRYQLERARDVDVTTRRIVYTRILPNLNDFRYLSLAERDKMIRWGLRDRDDTVRKAAARLFYERWIEDCASKRDTRPEEERVGTTAPPSRDGLCELLERIDIVRAGQEDGMAHEAMKQFWAARPDYLEAMIFDHDFWLALDPPAAFIVRTLNDFGQATDDERVRELIEDKMPALTQFAFIIQKQLNLVIENAARVATLDEDDPALEEAVERSEDSTFVATQLLNVSLTLDYADEVGRRQMYNITQEAIAKPALPEDCTKLAIEVLRIICGSRGESDFVAVIMEAIAEVHDTLLDDDDDDTFGDAVDAESFHSAQSEHSSPAPANRKEAKPAKKLSPEEEEEERTHIVAVNSKCLHIMQCTLQNVTCDLNDNTNLTAKLNTLIIPAVQSHENVLRERGLLCLGSAALLSKDLAASNLELFFHCFNKGNDDLKDAVLQILSDLIITYPDLLAPPVADPDTTEQSELPEHSPILRPLMKVLIKGIESEDVHVSRTGRVAAQKLVLHNLLPPESTAEIVKSFTISYFNPDLNDKAVATQGLGYFIPVFCHSKIQNAQLMATVVVPVIAKLLVMRDEIEDNEDSEMVGWPNITAHLSEWTDGRKVVGQSEVGLDGKVSWSAASELPHLALAIDILERALTNTCTREEPPSSKPSKSWSLKQSKTRSAWTQHSETHWPSSRQP